MIFIETFMVALQAIKSNFFRSALTMLGIIIGVSAVITMLAIGTGAQDRIESQIDELGANRLSISSSRTFFRGVSREQASLEFSDAVALKNRSNYLEEVVPILNSRNQIKYANKNINSQLVGTTEGYFKLNNYEISTGRPFSDQEDLDKARLVVLGSSLPIQLGFTDPKNIINKQITVRSIPFIVVGVLDEIGSDRNSPDEKIIIPINTAISRVVGASTLALIDTTVEDYVSLEVAMVDIERVLRSEHKLLPGDANDFSIYDQKIFLETREQASRTFTYLLASIAGISLLVGGIGIMNIMIVSVTERTREIGIRMALGATRFNILMQFLIESMVLCLIGGILGIILGFIMSISLANLANWVVSVSIESVILSVLFSISVGLFFGILPARKASNLDPIEALRHE
ncbi:MAG: multidrug ABC transporter substrate-binding protein [Gammaproteobacteria bacterium]|nr:multidrug ABC transporter substrate-binding protein [Gammaproteobacteria bacterium]